MQVREWTTIHRERYNRRQREARLGIPPTRTADCADCGIFFEALGTRGRVPTRCPGCATARARSLASDGERRNRRHRNERQNALRAAGYRPPPLSLEARELKNKLAVIAMRRWIVANPARAKILATTASMRRRARVSGCVEIEDFTSIEIFERDDWICHICKVPTSGQHPELTSPSIDHVIPLSRGGQHTRANVKTAHLVCNLRKGSGLLDV